MLQLCSKAPIYNGLHLYTRAYIYIQGLTSLVMLPRFLDVRFFVHGDHARRRFYGVAEFTNFRLFTYCKSQFKQLNFRVQHISRAELFATSYYEVSVFIHDRSANYFSLCLFRRYFSTFIPY